MPKAVIEIKLGACLTSRTEAFHRELMKLAVGCRQIRNGAMSAWLQWIDANPDYQPQQRKDRNGKLKVTKDGTPIMESAWLPQHVQKLLYDSGRKANIAVSSHVASHCVNAVMQYLAGDLPYNQIERGAPRCKVWQAIRDRHINAPSYSALVIPVPKANSDLCYNGQTTSRNALLKECGKSSAVVSIPMWSREAGREKTTAICRIETRQLSRGNRQLLQRIARDKDMHRDSQIVLKDGRWQFQLTYQVEQELYQFDPARQARLVICDGTSGTPFRLELPGVPDWSICREESKLLVNELARLETRRKTIGKFYREGRGHGHGRRKAMANAKRIGAHETGLRLNFMRKTIAEVVKAVTRFECGTLIVESPNLFVKNCRNRPTWFSDRGVTFAWHQVVNTLGQKLPGVQVDQLRIGKEEWLGSIANAETANAPCESASPA